MVSTRALIFHMSVSCDKTFPWLQKSLTFWPWPWCLSYLLKTLTLAIFFLLVSTRTLIFHMSVSSDKTFQWVQVYLTLTFVFNLHIENFNLAYIFWIVCSRIWIFHMNVCCDKSFQWVPTGLTLWTWPLHLTYLLKTLILAVSFEWYVLGFWYFTWVFFETRLSHRYIEEKFLSDTVKIKYDNKKVIFKA
jgi:hypothetical protein